MIPTATPSQRAAPWKAILLGGLAVGVLDITQAILVFGGIYRVPPIRIWQSVAAGLVGPAIAFGGGLRTAVLGGCLHFFIATTIAAVYYLASRRIALLVR